MKSRVLTSSLSRWSPDSKNLRWEPWNDCKQITESAWHCYFHVGEHNKGNVLGMLVCKLDCVPPFISQFILFLKKPVSSCIDSHEIAFKLRWGGQPTVFIYSLKCCSDNICVSHLTLYRSKSCSRCQGSHTGKQQACLIRRGPALSTQGVLSLPHHTDVVQTPADGNKEGSDCCLTPSCLTTAWELAWLNVTCKRAKETVNYRNSISLLTK